MAKIESINKESFIVLRLEEQRDEGFRCCHLTIEIQLGHFSGRDDEVWVEQAALEGFLDEMKELERTRRGRATLQALSANALLLQVKVIDAAGHVEATVRLRRPCYEGGDLDFLIQGGFTLEPSLLPVFVRDLSDLAT